MKRTFNLTTSPDDLARFPERTDLLRLMEGFDGVELMCLDEDVRGVVPPDRVIGVHMGFFPCWLDFWNGDEAAVLREFGSREVCEGYYGGRTRDAMVQAFRRDLENAHRWGAEYVVLHTSDATLEETFTMRYHHTDEEVVDGMCELVNEVFAEEDGFLLLLLENLWQPGMTFTRPEITARLLDGVKYPNRGIMLDTGHLLHTNLDLETMEEGLTYIHGLLDAHGGLCRNIRGVHLNQSLTGAYCKRVMADPPVLAEDYFERCGQMYLHAFQVDQHRPFTCPGVRELIERIDPDYLTFEFITENLEQHRAFLAAQSAAFSPLS